MQYRSPSAVADGFVPARLTIARKARGLKQVELAAAIESTPATVSKWEGETYAHVPDKQTVAQLASLLSIRESWFFKPVELDGKVAFFRSLKSALNVARDKASAKLHFLDDIYQALLERVEFPAVDIPNVMGNVDYKSLTTETIDRLASDVREFWGLGDDPIDDLMVVVENAGVAVAEDFVESTRLDGVSRWFGTRPVMLLTKDKNGGVRRRFDAAHELAHLVLHQAVTEADLKRDITLIEEQAMAFAGSLLLPASSFASDIHDITLDGLADLKPKWKVSIGAMIKRLRSLDLITGDHERNLWKYYSYRQWRGNEPHDDTIEVERPINLKTAVEMIANEGPREVADLMDDIGLMPDDIVPLTGIDSSLLAVAPRSKPRLRIVQRDSANEQLRAAND